MDAEGRLNYLALTASVSISSCSHRRVQMIKSLFDTTLHFGEAVVSVVCGSNSRARLGRTLLSKSLSHLQSTLSTATVHTAIPSVECRVGRAGNAL